MTTALLVENGAPLASREELVASVAAHVPFGLLAEIEQRELFLLAVPVEDRKARALDLHRSACAALAEGTEPDRATVVSLIALVQHILARDDVVMETLPEDAPLATRLWSLLLRQCPFPYDAEVGVIAAHLAYAAGNGALAHTALMRVFATDPEHRLGGILYRLLEHGVPPSAWNDQPSRRERRARRPRGRRAS